MLLAQPRGGHTTTGPRRGDNRAGGDLPLDQIERIVALLGEVLGEDALGGYLHGSAVLGTLHPRSDIDVLVVSRRATTVVERHTLIDRLLPMSGRGDPSGRSRPIELTIVVESDVRPWQYPPPLDFLYGDWWRAEFERGEVAPWSTPNPDLALTIAIALQGNRPLFGPPPAEVLDPVPPRDLARAGVAGIPGLLADLDDDTANVILTLARVWTTVATGVVRSKDAAAEWALARLPEERRAPLVRALGVYVGDEADRWDDLLGAVRAHVDQVVAEIARAGRTA